jgi:hypothetical protein
MNKLTSPFYPPRARWYSSFVYLGNALRRRLALDRLTLPREMKAGELVAGFFVPGAAVWLRGPKTWGRAALAGSAALVIFFIVWLGYPEADLALGLLISIHATGFIYYCNPLMAGGPFRFRLAFTILVLLALGLGFYLPIQHSIQAHWLMPLRNGNQVIIVSIQHDPASLKPGDWAAFSADHNLLFGLIVGQGGDRVGSVTVPENHWLIRTQIARRYYHHGFLGGVSSEIIEQLTIVSPEEFIGKPFKRWFWRKQILP